MCRKEGSFAPYLYTLNLQSLPPERIHGVCVCAPCCVMSTGKLYITHTQTHIDTHIHTMLLPTSLPPTIKLGFFSTRFRVEECCFLWGFNSLFTAVLLVQNPFLEANVNQSNFMSAQAVPRFGLAGICIFAPPLRGIRQLKLRHLHHPHWSQEDVIPSIPCFQACHTTKPPVCYCCLFRALFIDLHDAL